MPLQIFHEFEF